MTDAPADELGTTRDLLAKTWLDANKLLHLPFELGFDGAQQKLIRRGVEAIARSARRERSKHHENDLAQITFQPLYSPPATSGLAPTICLDDVRAVIESPDNCHLVRKHFSDDLTNDIVRLLQDFVHQYEADHPS